MKSQLIVLISALGGILIGTIGNVIVLWITKKYEYSKEIKNIIFEYSFKEWEDVLEHARKTPGRTSISPPAHFIVFNSHLSRLIGKKKFNKKAILKLFAVSDELAKIINEHSNSSHKNE